MKAILHYLRYTVSLTVSLGRFPCCHTIRLVSAILKAKKRLDAWGGILFVSPTDRCRPLRGIPPTMVAVSECGYPAAFKILRSSRKNASASGSSPTQAFASGPRGAFLSNARIRFRCVWLICLSVCFASTIESRAVASASALVDRSYLCASSKVLFWINRLVDVNFATWTALLVC